MKEKMFGRYLLAYLFWLISIGVAMLAALAILDTSVYAMAAAEWGRYQIQAVRQFTLFILGIILLALLVFSEHYFRTGVKRKRLLERFARLTGLYLLVMAGFHGLYATISTTLGTPSWFHLISFVVELAFGATGFWYARRAKNAYLQMIRRAP